MKEVLIIVAGFAVYFSFHHYLLKREEKKVKDVAKHDNTYPPWGV